jgi:hypothetical protein
LAGLFEPPPAQQIDRQRVARRGARTRLMPGSAGSVETLSRIMTRMPIVPSFAAQSAIVSATPGSFGSTGLTRPNRPGCAARTSSA